MKYGNRLSVCDSKVLYDTEFAAEIAAAKIGHKFDEEMYHYSCLGIGVSTPHYHIAHKSKRERRGAGYGYTKCDRCGLIMKREVAAQGRHVCPKASLPVQLTA